MTENKDTRMSVFLDDERQTPPGPGVWVRVFTVPELKALIVTHGLKSIKEISLDHDLGEGQETGYDFLKWLSDVVLQNKVVCRIPPLAVHSANPVGRQYMEMAIKKIAEHTLENACQD